MYTSLSTCTINIQCLYTCIQYDAILMIIQCLDSAYMLQVHIILTHIDIHIHMY